MDRQHHDTSAFEGLIFSTATKFEPVLDEELDEIRQILRIKVWHAICSYNSSRSKMELEHYVFGCVYNKVKDMLKSQGRREVARGGRELSLGELYQYEADQARLSISEEAAFAVIEAEELELPETITRFERSVVILHMAGFNQTEIAKALGATRKGVRHARTSVREKLATWRPEVFGDLMTTKEAA